MLRFIKAQKKVLRKMETALITGATSGIGAAFARELASRQMNLFLVARSEETLKEQAKQLQEQYDIHVEVVVQDLTAPSAGTAVYNVVHQNGVPIDLLINNAGFGDYGAFSESDLLRQLEMIQLNIHALVELTHLFLPGMKQRGYGSIINVSSIGGFVPLPYMSVYAASKAFVLSFSEALWAENRDLGIRIQALCPGPTETKFFQVAGFPDSMRRTPKQLLTSPEEVVLTCLKALEKGDSTVVTGGLKNQAIVNLPRFFPRDRLVSLMEKVFRRGKGEE